jgi:hypothetical protein
MKFCMKMGEKWKKFEIEKVENLKYFIENFKEP